MYTQRKRVSVGHELLINPSVILLDGLLPIMSWLFDAAQLLTASLLRHCAHGSPPTACLAFGAFGVLKIFLKGRSIV